ncbi:MAG: hypothetical protein KDJ47_11155 [Hyphomicrobiaceae bacterium]|nr:hypothetical protein [Hyphomicrobiaceae bacterium]
MNVEDPRFPPLITGHSIAAPHRVFDTACASAASGALGAADLVWARNTNRIDLALILEPDVPRARAMEIVPLFEVAVIEAVGALMPPQTAVQLRWPDELLVNGGVAGRFRFAMADCAQGDVPDWLVAGVDIVLGEQHPGGEAGIAKERTSLLAEGAGEKNRSDFLEVISAFVLSWIDTWGESGLHNVHDAWIGRVEGHGSDGALFGAIGRANVLGLDDELRLLVRGGDGRMHALPLAELVAWLDAKTAGAVGA